VKSDSYVGTDVLRDVELVVEDASKLEEEEKTVEEVIPEGSGTFPHFFVGWGLIAGR
jgi:hypothetical protein